MLGNYCLSRKNFTFDQLYLLALSHYDKVILGAMASTFCLFLSPQQSNLFYLFILKLITFILHRTFFYLILHQVCGTYADMILHISPPFTSFNFISLSLGLFTSITFALTSVLRIIQPHSVYPFFYCRKSYSHLLTLLHFF